MENQPWNAESAMRYMKKQQEKEMQPKIQIAELQKQTFILSEAKELTRHNADITKELVECTKHNQISADKQAKSADKLAKVAIGISILALIVNVIQLFK